MLNNPRVSKILEPLMNIYDYEAAVSLELIWESEFQTTQKG